MTLIWLCSAWLAGIVLADWFGVPPVPALIVAGLTTALGLTWRRTTVGWLLALLAALAFGCARGNLASSGTDSDGIWSYADRTDTLIATVARHPDWNDDGQVIIVAAEQWGTGASAQQTHGLVRLSLPAVPALHYGQRLELKGRLHTPPVGTSFDFRAYLARHSIYVVMDRPQMQVLDYAGHQNISSRLLAFNDLLRSILLRLLPEPHAGLLAGMLLGTQAAVPSPVLQDFRVTGTSHLLVISGWNITILVASVTSMLSACGLTRRSAALGSLPFLIVYVLFVGASPSVVRAGIMGALVIWAEMSDREADAWTGLLVTCVILATIDPNVLWDAGFQLTVAGTAGVITWSTPLRRWMQTRPLLGHPLLAAPADTVTATCAALMLVLPIVLYHFNTFSPIAPLANVMLAPVVPPAMFFGLCAVVLGLVWLPLGQFAALLAWPWTSWLVWGAQMLAHVPYASVEVPAFSAMWLWLWYGGLALYHWWRGRP